MKLFRSIRIDEQKCPPDLYEAISRLKPDGKKVGLFFLEAQPGDEENAKLVEQIVKLCEQSGLKRTRGDTVGSYVYTLERVYTPADYEAAPLLLLHGGRPFLHDLRREDSGRLVLPATKATKSLKLASVFPTNWVIISHGVRQILEAGGLVGLRFAEVIVQGESKHAVNAPFWELGSSITLPKMLNSIAYPPHPFPCYGIDEPPFGQGEPHYRARELHLIGAFDIAQTFEPLGGPDPGLIISQRFYQHCCQHEIRLDVRPVRIDSD
jgi:hypothetical protein